MIWTYYEGLWKTYLDWSEQYVNSLGSEWKQFYSTIMSLFRLSSAESIITFLIVIPIIIIQVLLFMDKNTSYTYLEETKVNPSEGTLDQIKITKS